MHPRERRLRTALALWLAPWLKPLPAANYTFISPYQTTTAHVTYTLKGGTWIGNHGGV